MTKSINERLNDELNQAEQKIEELQEKIEKLSRNQDWRATFILTKEENLDLPIPRLEIRHIQSGPNEVQAKYGMVYKHLLGDIIHVPLGQTKCGSIRYLENLDLPFRDGVHLEMVSI